MLLEGGVTCTRCGENSETRNPKQTRSPKMRHLGSEFEVQGHRGARPGAREHAGRFRARARPGRLVDRDRRAPDARRRCRFVPRCLSRRAPYVRRGQATGSPPLRCNHDVGASAAAIGSPGPMLRRAVGRAALCRGARSRSARHPDAGGVVCVCRRIWRGVGNTGGQDESPARAGASPYLRHRSSSASRLPRRRSATASREAAPAMLERPGSCGDPRPPVSSNVRVCAASIIAACWRSSSLSRR